MRKQAPLSHRLRGLTQAQAADRLAQCGPNIVAEAKPAGLGQILLRQFMSPFIYILLIAAAVSLAIGQVQNTVFILAVLALNAGIGAYQEFAAGKAASALRDMVRGQATVIRGGQRKRIDSRDLVPGDWVLLESGDKVPADLTIRHEAGLSVDESMLTGESHAVEKEEGDEAFGGTIVTRGRAEGEVTATGADTEIGAIARSVTAAAFAEPPLMGRIKRFTQTLAIAILGAIALLVGVMALNGAYSGQDMVMMAVGLAVSAIPEGLPAALTVTLAIGMNRMAKRNAIIRRLVAVEALGSCTVIASDKTGTLTVNELTIRRVTLPDGETFEIEGAGILPEGQISGGDPARLRALAVAAVHANEARLFQDDGQWIGEGDAVDLAFLSFAHKAGLNIHDIKEREAWLAAMPYESERAWSGTLVRSPDGPCLHVKGSLERVLPMCGAMAGADGPIELNAAAVQAQAHVLARRGFKVLAVASGLLPGAEAVPEAPDGLIFQGIAGMIDPLRPEAAEAVERCRKAGIRVVMVTGDHPETARAIAADLGLIRYDDADTVIGGDTLEAAFSRGEGDAEVERARVFARIGPDLKRRIAESLIRNGHFVAMTGDGVNDAPALRHANVGIAMGRRGTDVARETADVILADDHFASIVNGVEEGRIVYANIRKVIALLVATGASAILLFFLAALFGLPMPMTAVQLLWLNLVANGLQDVALAFEPGEGDELKRPPRDPAQPIFERHLLTHVMVNGAWMGLAAFAMFWWTQMQAMELAAAQNLVLMLMVLFGNVHAWNSRSETRPPYRLQPLANPFLLCAIAGAQTAHIAAMHLPVISDVLGLRPIAPETWLALLAVAASLFLVDTLAKRGAGRH